MICASVPIIRKSLGAVDAILYDGRGQVVTLNPSHRMNIEQSLLCLVFPKEVFTWFDPVECARDEKVFRVTFQEKNIPPEHAANKKAVSKGFSDITITDFPIRGRTTFLTFRRRYWQIEGEKEYLKRDIKLSFPGTQLEQEFADFLKADC